MIVATLVDRDRPATWIQAPCRGSWFTHPPGLRLGEFGRRGNRRMRHGLALHNTRLVPLALTLRIMRVGVPGKPACDPRQ